MYWTFHLDDKDITDANQLSVKIPEIKINRGVAINWSFHLLQILQVKKMTKTKTITKMDIELVEYLIYSVLMILLGIGIHKYLKWAKVNDLKLILGINVFWLKFIANTLIILGIVSFIFLLIAVYFDLSLTEPSPPKLKSPVN